MVELEWESYHLGGDNLALNWLEKYGCLWFTRDWLKVDPDNPVLCLKPEQDVVEAGEEGAVCLGTLRCLLDCFRNTKLPLVFY